MTDSYKVLDTGTSGYLPPQAKEHGVATWEWRKYEDGHDERVLIAWHRYRPGEAPWDEGWSMDRIKPEGTQS